MSDAGSVDPDFDIPLFRDNASPTFSINASTGSDASTYGSPQRGDHNNTTGRLFLSPYADRESVSYEDKTVHTHAIVKLSNSDRYSRGSSVSNNGSDFMLTGTVCVRLENITYFNVIFTMQPATDGENVQLNVCIHKCPKRKQGSQDLLGQFNTCFATLKFLGKEDNIVFTKNIQVERHGFCRALGHSFRNEISSVCNSSFHSLKAIRLLSQKTESSSSPASPMNDDVEFVLVAVEIAINFTAKVTKTVDCERYNSSPNETYHVAIQSKRRKLQPMCEPWSKTLLSDDTFTDITFKVGPNLSSTFQCHKCILAARSPVFRAMFVSRMKESESGVIELPDVNEATMNTFLCRIYETESQHLKVMEPNLIVKVLALAHKYQIAELLEDCTRSLISFPCTSFSIKLALDLFATASRFGICDLEFKALQCITHNKDKLSAADGKEAVRDFMKYEFELSPALLIGLFSSN